MTFSWVNLCLHTPLIQDFIWSTRSFSHLCVLKDTLLSVSHRTTSDNSCHYDLTIVSQAWKPVVGAFPAATFKCTHTVDCGIPLTWISPLFIPLNLLSGVVAIPDHNSSFSPPRRPAHTPLAGLDSFNQISPCRCPSLLLAHQRKSVYSLRHYFLLIVLDKVWFKKVVNCSLFI